MHHIKPVWQEALSDLITNPKDLIHFLELSPDLIAPAQKLQALFPLKATRSFVNRIQKGNINDPLLKQILPIAAEYADVAGYQKDPLGERKSNPIPGLLQKYHGRVLMTLTSACAVHCRYCFRRHFPYEENNPGLSGWERIFHYIKEDATIEEVILSGGDPLAVSDRLLQRFTAQLTQIPHVKRLRIHTRMPIVLPERITETFLLWLKSLPLQTSIVVHVNHAQEIDSNVQTTLLNLKQGCLALLNQSVLLRGVNDDSGVLITLSEKLFASGVLPYYLHVLDKVEGAAHFDLPLATARQLHQELVKRLPGYLVPRLICETPGAFSKTNLST